MHYRVRGHVIRSENAAKPSAQANRFLLRWLRENARGRSALDYGCGKLRYADSLAAAFNAVTLVDSRAQLDRTQWLCGEYTTIGEIAARRWRHARALSVEEFERDDVSYGFILCANVLSTIPCRATRRWVVRALAARLARGGRCLFCCQFRNTYFTAIRASGRAIPHLDGWIVPRGRSASFYGIIAPRRLRALVAANGHTVVKCWTNRESAYLLTGR